MKYRHPDSIVPINGQEELLLAIYDRLGDLVAALAPASPEPAVTEAEASEAGRTLAQHEHQTAAPKKRTPRAKAKKKTA